MFTEFIEVFRKSNIDYLIEKKQGIGKLLLFFYLLNSGFLAATKFLLGTTSNFVRGKFFANYSTMLFSEPIKIILIPISIAILFFGVQFILIRLLGHKESLFNFFSKSLFIFTLPVLLNTASTINMLILLLGRDIIPLPYSSIISIIGSLFYILLQPALFISIIYCLYLQTKFIKKLTNFSTLKVIISMGLPITIFIILIVLIGLFFLAFMSLGGWGTGFR